MQLNLPIADRLVGSKHILIAGMGGGYDVFTGLPLYLELQQQGFEVHLANLTFTDIDDLDSDEWLIESLVGVSEDIQDWKSYFPEYDLASWLADEKDDYVTVWCFAITGGRRLAKDYEVLVKHLDIDAVILVDGGVDSLMQGDEPEAGTMFEDTLSITAVKALKGVKAKIVACLGLGIEHEIGYAHLFENISSLAKTQDFLGCCALTQKMDVFQDYKDAVLTSFRMHSRRPSVICSSVISAVEGQYGNYHMTQRTQMTSSTLNVSALMSIYWFFDLNGVAKKNLLVPILQGSYSREDAWKNYSNFRDEVVHRGTPADPLP